MRTPCTESACSWATSTAQTHSGTRAKTIIEAGQDAAFVKSMLRDLLAGRQCRASETLLELSMHKCQSALHITYSTSFSCDHSKCTVEHTQTTSRSKPDIELHVLHSTFISNQVLDNVSRLHIAWETCSLLTLALHPLQQLPAQLQVHH